MSFLNGVSGATSNLSAMSLARIDSSVQQKILVMANYASSMGQRLVITSGFRDMALQNTMYQRYLNGKTKYPVAPPGRSWHGRAGYTHGVAIDFNIEDVNGRLIPSNNQLYRQYGLYWETLGSLTINGIPHNPIWGGRFNDPIHLEYRAQNIKVPPLPASTTPADPLATVLAQDTGKTVSGASAASQQVASEQPAICQICPAVE